ncbi:unnamed protein product [Angiostrongylus costaricensis]|uniref:Uncharacterized protein n=1 Tax=Angiostrongylus costaricensis TaxID=334426 RepID=A0A0R3Q2W8_ANGCS|nr:unnamed protein product [Angiostrongylus costaricensis]
MSRTEKRNAIPFPMRRNQNSDLGRTRTADLLCHCCGGNVTQQDNFDSAPNEKNSKQRARADSNRRISVCETDVITTTPRDRRSRQMQAQL